MGRQAPTLGLVMIVRDEEATLPRLAASARDQIDHFTIVDTGSTDQTVAITKRCFGAVPGDVLSFPWRGFGASRTEALRQAERHTEWLLCLDADEELTGTIDRAELWAGLDAVYVRRHSGPTSLWLPRLVASSRGWEWRGRTHEYLAMPDGLPCTARSEACYIVHHGDGGSRADKYQRDLELLAKDWADMPGDPRTAFYLARTYDDLGQWREAANWYRRRAALGGWEEERWYASYRLGACLLAAGEEKNGCRRLWGAWRERKARAEPLVALAEHYRLGGAWPDAWRACQAAFASTTVLPLGSSNPPLDDLLFIDTDVYLWRAAYEASMAAWYVGDNRLGLRMSDHVLSCPGVPEVVRAAVTANRGHYKA